VAVAITEIDSLESWVRHRRAKLLDKWCWALDSFQVVVKKADTAQEDCATCWKDRQSPRSAVLGVVEDNVQMR
jgi:hypothetical protein